MKMLSRRQALAASAAFLPVALGAMTCSLTAAQWQTDVNTVADGLSNLVPLITAAGAKISAGTLAQIQKAIDDIKANAAGIGAAATPNGTVLQQIQQDVVLVSTLVAPFFPAASAIGALVAAAVSLVGFVLQEAGVVSSLPRLAAPAFDPITARAILKAGGQG